MVRFAALFVFLLATIAPLRAQPSFTPAQRDQIVTILREALKRDPSILRDALAAVQADDQLKQQASARAAIAAAQSALVASSDDPSAGNPSGDVTVVEFYDIRCPYCRRMLPVVADLLKQDGRVRWVYKDLPILGPASMIGARAVLAAQRQGNYGRFRELLMSGPPDITESSVRATAERAGLDWERLRRDMDDPRIAARLRSSLELARKLDINGTPAYVIGGRLLPGAVDLADLQEAVGQARRP